MTGENSTDWVQPPGLNRPGSCGGVHTPDAGGHPLKAPFPYAGGKSRVAGEVWSRFGNVENYAEPFMGTLAVLLRRPADHFRGGYRTETANDANHYLVNFWRSVKADPGKVAEWADWPVTEADLHARHKWLVRSREADEFRKAMSADPDHFDAKVAGWWCWGACGWIGGAWCQDEFVGRRVMPLLDPSQQGVHSGQGEGSAGQPDPHGRPQLADTWDVGRGVNGGGNLRGSCDKQKRPQMTGNGPIGCGVLSMPQIGTCDARREWLTDWMRRLADRLRLVRTCYGHWSRVCDSESTLTRLGLTGVFLDPPYPLNRKDTGKKSRDGSLYANDRTQDLDLLRDEVLDWCRRWGGNKSVRAAVCCYEGDGYEPLLAEGWTPYSWEASGGYANQRRGGKGKAENARRERIYFSPNCLPEGGVKSLFDSAEGGADGPHPGGTG